MKHLTKLCLTLSILALFSCGDDAAESVDPLNSSPGTFVVSVSDITAVSANITWAAPVDPDGDNLTYTVMLGSNVVAQNQTSLNFEFDQLTANTAYSGSIVADDGNEGESTASFSFSTTEVGNEGPGSFTITTGTLTRTTASISWSAPTDPDGDVLTYDVKLDGTIISADQTELDYEFSNLTENTSYECEIVAKDGKGGESTAMTTFTTSVGNQSPGSFTITISGQTHNAASLSWSASVDPDGDNVTYSIEIDGSELASGVTTTSYDLTDLTSGKSITGIVKATDGNGGESEITFEFDVYVIDISKYTSMNGFVSATLVDCSYSEGGSGKCYQIVFGSNPVDDEGPFCPETIQDVGGFGNYNGDGLDNGSATNGDAVGFSIMNAALFQAMENDGYDIIDGSGNIRSSDFSTQDNPNFGYCLEPLPDDNLTMTFEVPVTPVLLSSPDNIETVEYIGLALDGVPINGDPPTVAGAGAQGEGKIPSLDRCGGHHDPAGYYHWHFVAAHMNKTLDANNLLDKANGIECTKKEQDATVLVGYARDGYPIYSGEDTQGVEITDLDACNGHTSVTTEYPNGIYHYHASTDITNVPPCILGKQSTKAFDKPS